VGQLIVTDTLAQEIAAVALVACVAAWSAWRWWRRRQSTKRNSCGDCAADAKPASGEQPLRFMPRRKP